MSDSAGRSDVIAEISDESDVAVSDLEDSSDDSSDGANDEGLDNNSAEAVAVRLAFMASMDSSTLSLAGSQNDEGTWTASQILSWLDTAMVPADDLQQGAKKFWVGWSKFDRFLPRCQRQQIVLRLDQKLQANGHPGLRQLLSMVS